MKVIGSGFGRTGTTSIKAALEQLGFGPCYHMEEVLAISDRIAVMHEGRITGILDKEEFSEEAVMNLAVGGSN